jgi:hypothetical protein
MFIQTSHIFIRQKGTGEDASLMALRDSLQQYRLNIWVTIKRSKRHVKGCEVLQWLYLFDYECDSQSVCVFCEMALVQCKCNSHLAGQENPLLFQYRIFIIIFAVLRQWILFWACWIQSITSRYISLISISTLI